MHEAPLEERAKSFGSMAESYERVRPPYPADAVRWLVPRDARTVVDLAAGTGKLTRELLALGVEVVAVEPSEGMLAQLRVAVPGVRVEQGSAEAIPLPDGVADAVVVGQAWHWVDPLRAVPEVARVLRSGGTLGLVWNVMDERTPWVREYSLLLRSSGSQDRHVEDAVVGEPFGPLESFATEWAHVLPEGGLVELAASHSYVITLPEGERAALLDEVAALQARVARADGTIELPYVTRCLRARLAA